MYTEQEALSNLLVALDINGAENASSRISSLVWDQTSFVLDPKFQVKDSGLDADEAEMSEDAVRVLLYNVEDLRKQALGDSTAMNEVHAMEQPGDAEGNRPGQEE